jgi:hypothetical protein
MSFSQTLVQARSQSDWLLDKEETIDIVYEDTTKWGRGSPNDRKIKYVIFDFRTFVSFVLRGGGCERVVIVMPPAATLVVVVMSVVPPHLICLLPFWGGRGGSMRHHGEMDDR